MRELIPALAAGCCLSGAAQAQSGNVFGNPSSTSPRSSAGIASAASSQARGSRVQGRSEMLARRERSLQAAGYMPGSIEAGQPVNGVYRAGQDLGNVGSALGW